MVNSMQAITTYASAFFETAARRLRRPAWQRGLKTAAAGAAGFLLSAASLANRAVPVALGLLFAAPPGVMAAAIALGGSAGYSLFWREGQCLAWMAVGLLAVWLAGDSQTARQQKLLLPALAAVVVSGCGLGVLLTFGDDTPVGVYLLRVGMSAASTACFRAWRARPKGPAGWLAGGLATLALAQVAVHRYLGLGYVAAGLFSVRAPLPMAVMAGLGLDLARVTKIPMTGVLCLGFLPRLLPGKSRWLAALSPTLAYGAVSALTGRFDPLPVPGLLLGSVLGLFFPDDRPQVGNLRRQGPEGLAQVRLSQAAGAMALLEQSLLSAREPPLDTRALLRRAESESCDTCPERKGCKGRSALAELAPEILERPGLQTGDLPPGCRKHQRLLAGLRREQAQLRSIRADRARQRAYRAAVADQYRFLSGYLQTLSGELCDLHRPRLPRYRPEIGVSVQSRQEVCGDRWDRFSPREDVCFFLLCDGMGTGEGAAADAGEAMALIRTMLQAGFAPEMALRSFNSLSALRMSAGSATVDLVKLDLYNAQAVLYKWGAGVSYVLHREQLKKIGTAEPPPGVSQQVRESVYRLSLGGEETLILLSDGAGAEGLARPRWAQSRMPAGELAAAILADGVPRGDDATAAVIRLRSLNPDTPYHIATE